MARWFDEAGVPRRGYAAAARVRAAAQPAETRRAVAATSAAARRALKVLPEDDIVARYLAGESEHVLAQAYGIHRALVRTILLEAGVDRRDRAAAARMRRDRNLSGRADRSGA